MKRSLSFKEEVAVIKEKCGKGKESEALSYIEKQIYGNYCLRERNGTALLKQFLILGLFRLLSLSSCASFI